MSSTELSPAINPKFPPANSDSPPGSTDGMEQPLRKRSSGNSAGQRVPVKKVVSVLEPATCTPAAIPPSEKAPTRYAVNTVVTSKYTFLNFWPLFLWEQFSRIANSYFLFVSLVEENFFFPVATSPFNFSLTNGKSTNLPILMMVLFVEALTQISEDYKKHKADAMANAKPTRRYVGGRMVKCKWEDLVVGDIVEVQQGEEFPADLWLLCAQTKKGGGCPQAYVETKSLDGETNLKLRVSIPETVTVFQNQSKSAPDAMGRFSPSIQTCSAFKGCTLTCDDPRDPLTSKSIHTFMGTVKLPPACAECLPTGMKTTFTVNEKNILLRECKLKNTDRAFGMVVNTGPDTKVMRSATETQGKVSDLDKTINSVLRYFLVFIFLLCLGGAIAASLQEAQYQSFFKALMGDGFTEEDRVLNFFENFFLYFVGIAQMIPIALYVQLRMSRMLQSQLMEWDANMVHTIPAQFSLSGEEETISTKVRTADLNDELGQVGFVFSDKTGTLTQNIMDFRKMSVAGVSYGKGTTVIGIAALEKDGKFEEAAAMKVELDEQENCPDKVPYCSYYDHPERSAYDHMTGKGPKGQREKLEEFFRTLALCHSVEVEHRGNSLFYSSSSPDEQALCAGAKHFGFMYEDQKQFEDPKTKVKGAYRILRRAPPGAFDKMSLKDALGPNTKCEKWKILEVMEFTSKRKRMSVIVESEGKIKLLTKGADSVIFKRLLPSETRKELFASTKTDLLQFADDGLRTLAVAYRYISKGMYEKWKREFDAVLNNDEEQAKKKRQEPNKIDDKMGELENDLILLGATAIEDKLQVGVPDAIADLARAGIKLWVLTGDKEETAINIGFACQLLRTDMPRKILRGVRPPEFDRAGKMIAEPRKKTSLELTLELNEAMKVLRARRKEQDLRQQALVVDGEALEVCLDTAKPTDDVYKALLAYAKACKAVVACRVSPLQKSLMVSLIRDNTPGVKTLAIGDGANDVPMIQTAHIGIGIAGQEGMQAVRASDYAIGQFRFMKRLTLVHGRENYRRASILVNFMFYKNIVLCLVPFAYRIRQTTTEAGLQTLIGVSFFNVFQTGMPVLFLACYDRMTDTEAGVAFPRLYKAGPNKELFNVKVFSLWLLEALCHSAACYIVAMHSIYYWDLGTYVGGTMMSMFVAMVCNVRIGFEYQRIYSLTFVAIILSALAFPVIFYIYSDWSPKFWFEPKDQVVFYKVAPEAFSKAGLWFGFFLLSISCAMPTILVNGMLRRFRTTFLDLVQEAEKYGGDSSLQIEGVAHISRKRKWLEEVDKELWDQEKAGTTGAKDKEAGTAQKRRNSSLALSREDHSHSDWESTHTGTAFGHDDESAALEADLLRKQIRDFKKDFGSVARQIKGAVKAFGTGSGRSPKLQSGANPTKPADIKLSPK
jgi:phospholipid-transporting ATPase